MILLLCACTPSLVDAKPGAKFVRDQTNAARVKAARANWTDKLKARFTEIGVRYPARSIFLRVLKDDDVLELWASDDPHGAHKLVESVPVCARSGALGPKRQQGDLQVPEGFYVLDRFNAYSSYHLSLGVNYPNASDRARGKKPLGGDIFIHGDCVTIGCVPIEDEAIERVYVAALDSYVAHGGPVHVHIFPSRLDAAGLQRLTAKDGSHDAFWRELAPSYAAFEATKKIPRVAVKRGAYVIKAR